MWGLGAAYVTVARLPERERALADRRRVAGGVGVLRVDGVARGRRDARRQRRHPEVQVERGVRRPLGAADAVTTDRHLAVPGHVEQEAVARRRVDERDGDVELALLQIDLLPVALERHDARARQAGRGAAPLARPVALAEAVHHLVRVAGGHAQVGREVACPERWQRRALEARGALHDLERPRRRVAAVREVADEAALVGVASPHGVVDARARAAGVDHLGEAVGGAVGAAKGAIELRAGAPARNLVGERLPLRGHGLEPAVVGEGRGGRKQVLPGVDSREGHASRGGVHRKVLVLHRAARRERYRAPRATGVDHGAGEVAHVLVGQYLAEGRLCCLRPGRQRGGRDSDAHRIFAPRGDRHLKRAGLAATREAAAKHGDG